MSVAGIRARLAAGGFSLSGRLAASDYDALVPEPWRAAALWPGARGVLVVGNAGRELWPRFVESPEAALEEDPLDRYTARVFQEATAGRAGFALYCDKRDGAYLPLVALAERAGLGRPGRVGVLLHPEYGPWFSLRGIVAVEDALESDAPCAFDPCPSCPAPCERACHGGVISRAGVDVAGCYRARQSLPECALRCDARRACVIGPQHAFPPEQVAHHSKIRKV